MDLPTLRDRVRAVRAEVLPVQPADVAYMRADQPDHAASEPRCSVMANVSDFAIVSGDVELQRFATGAGGQAVTTLTKERIAEIADSVAARGATHMHIVTPEALADLCRLALLGLRVEEAPVYVADRSEAMWPAEFGVQDGERVRIVVEEP